MIENKLRESSFIDNCIVFGEHQKFASAIIIPNMKEVREWCAKNNMDPGESDEKLIGSKEVVTILNKEVTKINKTLFTQSLHPLIINENINKDNFQLHRVTQRSHRDTQS